MKIEKYKPLVDKVYRKLGISPINNVYVLLYLIDRTKNISGDIAEFGIYKGGTLACAALYLKEQGIDKKIYGFDSFKGFPKYSEYDLPDQFDILFKQRRITKEHYQKSKEHLKQIEESKNHLSSDKFSDTSKDDIIKLLEELGIGDNVKIFDGYFTDTVKNLKTKLSSVFLDCDLYDSYLTALENCYPLMEKGGVIILDEYYSLKYPGARIAVDEFFKNKPEKTIKLDLIANDTFERWYVQF